MNIKRLCIAHRGSHNDEIPENSMMAFRKSLSRNLPIEFDIHLLKDNNIIVFHDDNLYRMTGVNKKLRDCTYNEIKNLKLKNTNEKIPLLKDVLKLVDGKVLLDIELKEDHDGNNLEIELIKILKNYNGEFILKSFNYKAVKYLMKNTNYIVGLLYPDLDSSKLKLSPLKKMIIRNINFNIILKPHFLAISKKAINDKCIKKYKGPVLVWTIKTDAEKERFLKLADTVIFEDEKKTI